MAVHSFRVYTVDEVKKHDTESDAWIIINGYVHDVTHFLRNHPGGKDVVLEHLGSDATNAFTKGDLHSHSKAAFLMLEDYRVGVMENKGVESIATRKYDIDVNKPMLGQVGRLGVDYWDWVHTPIHPRSGGIRLFESDFMELFTRTPWWVIPSVWVPLGGYAGALAFESAPSILLPSFLIPCFFFLWFLLEYAIHRWVFHMYAGGPRANLVHFLLHGIHHLTPMDKDRLVFPPAPGIIIAAIVYTIVRPVAPLYLTMCIACGLIFGYMSYDLTHYYIHHQVPLTSHLRTMKTYHMNHHYKNPDAGYGITSKVFDSVFATLGE
mmetsp:Transcript_818/g.1325  ORF Transcript_818/g.1325 Transcript_818/m.1325 type:complete len:322 (-) Transcript_818:578-1543(-)|eukprot:CAMPEP_0184643674 /NCGR_PEP_ID=MMETSP0308-20130426/497_1 /TAXON_ID=38269 /ORGANISM="Gloeochaete witrockiana, Strain SAG 46.84" /LENGTH=321 /DNA_ID=CAMNT_0027071747 /DNA_START=43 /DNA_END=1008 /DNA_ORIENTATION=+